MNGVDIVDQLFSNYCTHVGGRETWLPLLFWLLDTSVTNSFIILRFLVGQEWLKDGAHKKFREE